MPILNLLRALLPPLDWGRGYSVPAFQSDLIAGIIVLFLTIPQVIAYAFLAGMPPETGLYAAFAALVGYGLFGGSRTLAVGPQAIIAIMTLEAATKFAAPYSAEYLAVVARLGLVIGGMLVLLRIVNFGAVISFLSHAVITGFIAAAALLIIASQIPSILGLPAPASTSLVDIGELIAGSVHQINYAAVGIAGGSIALLLFCKFLLQDILLRLGMGVQWAGSIVRSAPMYVVVLTILAVSGMSLDQVEDVAVVGDVPTQLPHLSLASISLEDIRKLAPSALLISMVVFLSNMSIAAAMASKRREKIDANQELVAAGVANLGTSLFGGFPVAGSFGRTAVNASAGALTPLASIVTGMCVIMTLVWFAPLFYYLPKAALCAIIVVSAAQLIEIHAIRKIFSFSPFDSVTFAFTFLSVLLFGVETGIITGIAISFVLLIRASSRPHIAVVGRWKDTEHFRNVLRHEVETVPSVLALRVDESLYFVNTRYIENYIFNRVAELPEVKHVLLICTATNFIDSAGLELLELLSDNLAEVGVTLHLSEVKSPVMDRLEDTEFYKHMKGKVFFTTDLAMKELAGERVA